MDHKIYTDFSLDLKPGDEIRRRLLSNTSETSWSGFDEIAMSKIQATPSQKGWNPPVIYRLCDMNSACSSQHIYPPSIRLGITIHSKLSMVKTRPAQAIELQLRSAALGLP